MYEMIAILITVIILISILFMIKLFILNKPDKLTGGKLNAEIIQLLQNLSTCASTIVARENLKEIVKEITNGRSNENYSQFIHELVFTLLAQMKTIIRPNRSQQAQIDIFRTTLPSHIAVLECILVNDTKYRDAYINDLYNGLFAVSLVMLKEYYNTKDQAYLSNISMLIPSLKIIFMSLSPDESPEKFKSIAAFTTDLICGLNAIGIPNSDLVVHCCTFSSLFPVLVPILALFPNILERCVGVINHFLESIIDTPDMLNNITQVYPSFLHSFIDLIVLLHHYSGSLITIHGTLEGFMRLNNEMLKITAINSLIRALPPDEEVCISEICAFINYILHTEEEQKINADSKIQVMSSIINTKPMIIKHIVFIDILWYLFKCLGEREYCQLAAEVIIKIMHMYQGVWFGHYLKESLNRLANISPDEPDNIPTLQNNYNINTGYTVVESLWTLISEVGDSQLLDANEPVHVSKRVVQVILDNLINVPEFHPEIVAKLLMYLQGNCFAETPQISRYQSMVIQSLPENILTIIPDILGQLVRAVNDEEKINELIGVLTARREIDPRESFAFVLLNTYYGTFLDFTSTEDDLLHADRILASLFSHNEIYDIFNDNFNEVLAWIAGVIGDRNGDITVPGFQFMRTLCRMIDMRPDECLEVLVPVLHEFTTPYVEDLDAMLILMQHLLPHLSTTDTFNVVLNLLYMPIRMIELEIPGEFVYNFLNFIPELLESLPEAEEIDAAGCRKSFSDLLDDLEQKIDTVVEQQKRNALVIIMKTLMVLWNYADLNTGLSDATLRSLFTILKGNILDPTLNAPISEFIECAVDRGIVAIPGHNIVKRRIEFNKFKDYIRDYIKEAIRFINSQLTHDTLNPELITTITCLNRIWLKIPSGDTYLIYNQFLGLLNGCLRIAIDIHNGIIMLEVMESIKAIVNGLPVGVKFDRSLNAIADALYEIHDHTEMTNSVLQSLLTMARKSNNILYKLNDYFLNIQSHIEEIVGLTIREGGDVNELLATLQHTEAVLRASGLLDQTEAPVINENHEEQD